MDVTQNLDPLQPPVRPPAPVAPAPPVPGSESEVDRAEHAESPDTAGQCPVNSDKSLTVYRCLIHDKRVSTGAFRLWHYLHNRRGKSGKCWPKQLTIALELGCKISSVGRWTSQLVEAGYLATEKVGQNHHYKYTVLCGDGKGDMPQWATPRIAPKGHTAYSPSGNLAQPQEATPRAAPKGHGSNNKVVIESSNGGSLPKVSQKFFPPELDKAIADQLVAIKRTPPEDTVAQDALWNKLRELETKKFGCPVTKRKPNAPKTTSQPSQTKAMLHYWNLPEQEQKALKAQLHAAVEIPPAPAPDSVVARAGSAGLPD